MGGVIVTQAHFHVEPHKDGVLIQMFGKNAVVRPEDARQMARILNDQAAIVENTPDRPINLLSQGVNNALQLKTS